MSKSGTWSDTCTNSPSFRREIHQHLVARYLVKPFVLDGQDIYSLHRQLQSKVLLDLQEDPLCQLQQVFSQGVALVHRDFPPVPFLMTPAIGEWPRYQKLVAHVIRLHDIFKGSSHALTPSLEVPFAELLASAGYYLFEIGNGLRGLQF